MSDMFEVIPDDSETDISAPTGESEDYNKAEISNSTNVNIDDFKEKAKATGYSPMVIEKAISKVDDRCKTFKDFEKIIDKVLDEDKSQKEEEKRREKRVAESTKVEIDYLCKIENIVKYADDRIFDCYGTHSVLAMDILKRATDEELNLDLYQEPIYSLILQVDKDWVAKIVQETMDNWKMKEYPRKFVEDYLRSKGISEDDLDKEKANLISYLSDDYMNDKAPDEYKQFKAVQQILQQSGRMDDESPDMSPEDIVEYGATMEMEMDAGTPAEAASACASEAAGKMSVSQRAGALCGSIMHFKYKTAKNFEDMFIESMGEYGDTYKVNREAAKTRKAELRKKRMESRLRKQERRDEIREEHKVEAANMRSQGFTNANVNNGYYVNQAQYGYQQPYSQKKKSAFGNNQYQYNQRYGAPSFTQRKLPIVVYMVVINVILFLFEWLLCNKGTATFGGIGLCATFYGMYCKRNNQQGAILYIIGGYLVYILTILWFMK